MDDACTQLKKTAEKKAQGSFFSSPKYEEAAELYAQAGNKYKLNKEYTNAAECFVLSGMMYRNVKDSNSEANAFVEAGNAAKKLNQRDSIKYFEEAIKLYKDMGRFSQAAKMTKNIAEMFEEESDYKQAIDMYKKSADLFDMDEFGKSQYSQCVQKYAALMARYDGTDIRTCIKVFELEGEKALRNTLLQFNAKEHFFKATILSLVLDDVVDTRIALERYENLDHRFRISREATLLHKVLDSFESNSDDQFRAALEEYDYISKLDGWYLYFFDKVRNNFTKVSEDEGTDLT